MALFKAGLIQLPLERYEEAASWAKVRAATSIARRVSFYPPSKLCSNTASIGWADTDLGTSDSRAGLSVQRDVRIEDFRYSVTESTLNFYSQLQEQVEQHCQESSDAGIRHRVLESESPGHSSEHSDKDCSQSLSSASSSSKASWAGGLRSRGSGSASSSSLSVTPRSKGRGGKGKKGRTSIHMPMLGKGSSIEESPPGHTEHATQSTINTIVEVPEGLLRGLQLWIGSNDFSDEIAEICGVQVEVDQSRRHGYVRIQIVGGRGQSLDAYQLLLQSLTIHEGVSHSASMTGCTKQSEDAPHGSERHSSYDQSVTTKRVWRRKIVEDT